MSPIADEKPSVIHASSLSIPRWPRNWVPRFGGGDAMKQHRIVWTEEWTTSIGWLDDEHRSLLDYYHAVVDTLREEGQDEVFLARLRDLRQWLGGHFKNEESTLQRIGCQEAYQHKQDHQLFIGTLEDFSRNSEKVYGYQDRLAVARYIFYWLMRHGKTYDAQITRYFTTEQQ